jgi:uncharacterized protein (DUF1015 family)
MIFNFIQENQIFSTWLTVDGREHTLWKIRDNMTALSEKFQKIDSLYILDGHHRLEAAHQNYLASGKKKEIDLWIQAIIYSS